MNNPLRHTDPTGEFFILAIGVIVFLVALGFIATPAGDTGGTISPEQREERFWTGISLIPGIDVLGDLWFATRDCGRAWDDPTSGNVGTCLFDVGVAIVPFAGVGLVKVGGRLLGRAPINQADNLADFFKRMDVDAGRAKLAGLPDASAVPFSRRIDIAETWVGRSLAPADWLPATHGIRAETIEMGLRYQARIDWGHVQGIGRTSRIVLEIYDATGVRTFVRHLAFYYG